MKHKLIILALVMSLVFVSQNTLSLGMGKIQVNSSLDESLNATIDIIANDDESIDQVSVKLASADDYKKVGLDKSFVPSHIMVSVDEDNPYQINIRSNGPVSEPIVSLLLDVTWANGRILREFTLLLDPPSYQTSTRGSISIPTTQPEPQQPDTMADVQDDAVIPQTDDIPPVSQDLNEAYENMDTDASETAQDDNEFVVETPMDENVSETIPALSGEVYVNTGDTLWRIANQNKPGDVSTHQMMMAIYDKNPDAFLNNNINEMIKGSTLQMPDAEEASGLTYSQALAEFQEHNNRWATDNESYSSFQTESQIDDDQTVAETVDYGVQLSGGEGDDADSQQTDGELADSGNSGLSDEEAFNASSENEELKSRVSELESIVDEQQSALELQDDDLANLETQMGQEPTEEVVISEGGFDDDSMVDDSDETVTDDVWDTASDDLTDAAEDSEDLLADDDTDQDTLLDAEEEELLSDSAVAEDSSETDQATEEPVVSTPQKSVQVSEPWYTAAINWIQQNVLWVIIGLVVLFLIVLLPKLLNRGDEDPVEEGSFLDDIKSSRGKPEAIIDEDDEVLDEDDETVLTTPIAVDDDADDDISEDETLDSFDDDDSDDVLAELDNSLAFDDSDDDDSDDDFEFDFDDDDDDSSRKSEQSLVDDQDQLDDDLGDDLDMETPTKEYDPAPFKDDDSFEDDFDLSDLDDDAEDDDLLDDDQTKSAFDDADEQSLFGDDDLDLEAELSELEDDFEVTDMDTDDDQDDDFSDDDFLAELDEVEDLDDDLDDQAVSEDLTEQLDDESDDDFDESISLDEDDQATTFETDQEDDDMDDDEIDLGLDDLMSDGDVIETKLDLAKAYIEMGDTEGAKNLLDEVKAEGNEAQKSEANKLIDDM